MRIDAICLDARLLVRHEEALVAYLRAPRLSFDQWVTLMEAIDWLGESTVTTDGQSMTFRTFYEVHVEAVFADDFLRDVVTMDDLDRDAPPRQAAVARVISVWLEQAEGFDRRTREGLQLLIYCQYWWAAFARGYVFEMKVFRDLIVSGVRFTAHDITDAAARRAPYDLTVLELNLRGDVKHSTYFLSTGTLADLRCDFFITRAFDAARREWFLVVVLTLPAWTRLDGDAQPTVLSRLTAHLPQPSLVYIGETPMIVITYVDWKARMLARQTREEGIP